MDMDSKNLICIYCERSSADVPLIPFEYRGKPYAICPQHLPILIHKPAQLAGRLPGLEKLSGPDEAHH
jgi:hypothetical protein